MPDDPSDFLPRRLFPLNERKAIGYFIEMVEERARKKAGRFGRMKNHLRAAMRELQKEHSLYD